ncbi:MAG: DUF2029 domain-containing protein [Acidobacteriia bacterium]|nr:DUF2029 domain-containing protein [Terriglobia bacterium]
MLLAVVILLMLADFVFRGVVPAFTSSRNDFSDPYVGAWLWRHGKNPYDVALVNATARQLTHSSLVVVPIYPPTAYVLVVPFSFLPWGWADAAWVLLSVIAVGITTWTLVRIGESPPGSDKTWFIATFVFAFASFHTAIHVGNAAPIAIACCFLAVYLARQGHDAAAGIMIALAAGLKPQLGLWIFVFYLLRRRWRLVEVCLLGGVALIGTAVVRIPLSLTALVANYREDLNYWFGPGGQNDFTTANPSRLHLVNLQVVLYPLVHSAISANLLAHAIFILGMVVWAYVVFRGGVRSEPLAISSLLALSFLSVYHRVNDAGILTLALCWALGSVDQQLRWTRRAVLFLLLLLLVPGQGVLTRLQLYLALRVMQSWWWNLVIAPYFIWVLFALSAVLLYAAVISGRDRFPQVAASGTGKMRRDFELND